MRGVDGDNVNLIYLESRNEQKTKKLLEPNHTDLIFIDDDEATVDQHGGNCSFRSQFEKTFLEETNNKIPVVLVMIKGGFEDVKKGFHLFDYRLNFSFSRFSS